jgi:tRNA nucleotidyltransferase (CCA-adding enzyme)
MQVYLVGGAVRDELLGLPVRERDWVVVGATPEEMLALGYTPVGRDFPVFLHPQSKEEYALARLERKSGPGYRGFTTDTAVSVTLEQDLLRRDLRINAIARASDGTLIDPYDGQGDLRRRLLRHVSEAFVEDPVRVLRVARFAARFAALGFTVAESTRELMRSMVRDGEVSALVAERVWRELERALAEPRPEQFFTELEACEALSIILPELATTWRNAQNHMDTPLRSAVTLTASAEVRFAALLGALDVDSIEKMCLRLRVPGPYRELAMLCARLGARIASAVELDEESLLELLEAADAVRRPERFAALLLAVQARAQPLSPSPVAWPAGARLSQALNVISSVRVSPDAGRSGPAIAAWLREQRLLALKAAGAGPAI